MYKKLPLLEVLNVQPLYFLPHTLKDIFRTGNSDALPQGHDPSEELRTQGYPDLRLKVVVIHDGQRNILAEAIDEHADHAVFTLEDDFSFVPGEHAKHALGVSRKVELAELLLALPGLTGGGDPLHFIHAIMLDLVGVSVICHDVIILVVPA